MNKRDSNKEISITDTTNKRASGTIKLPQEAIAEIEKLSIQQVSLEYNY